jgi:hypothetical protein
MDSPETQDEEQTKQKTQSRMDSPETQDEEQTKQKNTTQYVLNTTICCYAHCI